MSKRPIVGLSEQPSKRQKTLDEKKNEKNDEKKDDKWDELARWAGQVGVIVHWGWYSVPAYDSVASAKRRSTQNGSEWYIKMIHCKQIHVFRSVLAAYIQQIVKKPRTI